MASYSIPSSYNNYINTAAANNGLDPNALRGVIARESSFVPTKISPTGAIGLGQVLPSTGADPGYNVTPVSSPTQLFDPQTNINFTAQYLAARGTASAYSGNSYTTIQPIDESGSPVGSPVSSFLASSGVTTPAATAASNGSGLPVDTGNPIDLSATGGMPSVDAMGNPTGAPATDTMGTPPQYPAGTPIPQGTGGQATMLGGLLGNSGTSSTASSIASYFVRIALAVLALVMLAIAFVALTRQQSPATVIKGAAS